MNLLCIAVHWLQSLALHQSKKNMIRPQPPRTQGIFVDFSVQDLVGWCTRWSQSPILNTVICQLLKYISLVEAFWIPKATPVCEWQYDKDEPTIVKKNQTALMAKVGAVKNCEWDVCSMRSLIMVSRGPRVSSARSLYCPSGHVSRRGTTSSGFSNASCAPQVQHLFKSNQLLDLIFKRNLTLVCKTVASWWRAYASDDDAENTLWADNIKYSTETPHHMIWIHTWAGDEVCIIVLLAQNVSIVRAANTPQQTERIQLCILKSWTLTESLHRSLNRVVNVQNAYKVLNAWRRHHRLFDCTRVSQGCSAVKRPWKYIVRCQSEVRVYQCCLCKLLCTQSINCTENPQISTGNFLCGS